MRELFHLITSVESVILFLSPQKFTIRVFSLGMAIKSLNHGYSYPMPWFWWRSMLWLSEFGFLPICKSEGGFGYVSACPWTYFEVTLVYESISRKNWDFKKSESQPNFLNEWFRLKLMKTILTILIWLCCQGLLFSPDTLYLTNTHVLSFLFLVIIENIN